MSTNDGPLLLMGKCIDIKHIVIAIDTLTTLLSCRILAIERLNTTYRIESKCFFRIRVSF